MTAKLTAMMQNCVNKAGTASLSSVWSHLLYCKIVFEILVEHGVTLVQQIDVPKRVFFGGGHAIHLVQQFSVHERVHFF